MMMYRIIALVAYSLAATGIGIVPSLADVKSMVGGSKSMELRPGGMGSVAKGLVVKKKSRSIFSKVGRGVKVIERKTVNTVKDAGRIAAKDARAVSRAVWMPPIPNPKPLPRRCPAGQHLAQAGYCVYDSFGGPRR